MSCAWVGILKAPGSTRGLMVYFGNGEASCAIAAMKVSMRIATTERA